MGLVSMEDGEVTTSKDASTEVEDEVGELCLIGNEDKDEINNLVHKNEAVEVPKVEMMFNSEEEVVAYYKQYAKEVGFGVCKRTSRQGDDGKLRYFILACVRQGVAKSKGSNILRPRPLEKMNCKARINVALCMDGRWRLSSVVLEHTHALSPGKVRYVNCHRRKDPHVKRKLELNDNDKAGMRISKSNKSVVIEAAGYENLDFAEKDCRNYIDEARKLQLGVGGEEALRNYFIRMQEKNDGFYYVMDLDDECRLKTVFWADARSRAAYECFGDVVTFDTMYLTDAYKMPLVPFVGVNHHGQSILFGCGLVSNEDADTFVWLFETWLKCMSGRAPKAIITDQGKAMQLAIARVFPGTEHRFCLWHIMKKLTEKFGAHSQYDAIKSGIHNAVYDSLTIEEFEDNWKKLLDRSDLCDNAWLQWLYIERHHWVPIYLKNTFWAGMSTTQRSESMNSFFDDHVNSKTTLKQFVEQYDNALRSKFEKESDADFSSYSCMVPCISHYPIEKQFQDVYTNAKFKEVQEEFRRIMYCYPTLLRSEGAISTYEVSDRVKVNDNFIKVVSFCVDFNEEECEVKCTCKLFEFKGIVCRHALSILTVLKNVKCLPTKYILDRWRKDLKRKYVLVRNNCYDLSLEAQRYNELCKMFSEIAFIGSTSDQSYVMATNLMAEFKRKIISSSSKSESSQASHHLTGAFSVHNEATEGRSKECTKVLSHLVIRSKGRPLSKRRVSAVEKVVKSLRTKKGQLSDKSRGKNRKNTEAAQGTQGIVVNLNDDIVPLLQHDYLIGTQESSTTPGHSSQPLGGEYAPPHVE